MFVGHYAAAFAAKAIAPKAPLWALAGACQLVDIGWSVLIAAGVERASVDPALPGSTFVLEYMPWTHSLPAALLWSLAAVAIVRLVPGGSWRTSAIIGAVVFSHWLLDLIVHRPDLELWFGGDKVGLGLWNYPVPEQIAEMGLLAACGALWAGSRKHLGLAAWPAAGFIAFLTALQIVSVTMPAEAGPVGPLDAGLVLFVYILAAAAAALTELGGKRGQDIKSGGR